MPGAPTMKHKKPSRNRKSSRKSPRRRLSGPYEELITLVKQANLMGSTGSLLSWDQETMLPPRGVEFRSQQMAQVAKLSHEMGTSPRIGELLEACESDSRLMKDPMSVAAVNVREIRHEYDRKTKLPADLVEEEARLASVAQ